MSPGWFMSIDRKVSWKSSSRTAVPFAHAAHSHDSSIVRGRPNTVAPRGRGLASAWARAFATGWRAMPATATPALSSTRLTTMSTTSSSSGASSAATAASRHASSCSRGGVAALG